MKLVLKPFGQPETDEAKAVRMLVATPGFAQSILRVEYVDGQGNLIRYRNGPEVPPRRAMAERYVLTDEGAAKHDEILDNIGAGFVG